MAGAELLTTVVRGARWFANFHREDAWNAPGAGEQSRFSGCGTLAEGCFLCSGCKTSLGGGCIRFAGG